MTVVDVKMRQATRLLATALERSGLVVGESARRSIRNALRQVFEAAVLEAKGRNEPLPAPAPRAAPPEDETDEEDDDAPGDDE